MLPLTRCATRCLASLVLLHGGDNSGLAELLGELPCGGMHSVLKMLSAQK